MVVAVEVGGESAGELSEALELAPDLGQDLAGVGVVEPLGPAWQAAPGVHKARYAAGGEGWDAPGEGDVEAHSEAGTVPQGRRGLLGGGGGHHQGGARHHAAVVGGEHPGVDARGAAQVVGVDDQQSAGVSHDGAPPRRAGPPPAPAPR